MVQLTPVSSRSGLSADSAGFLPGGWSVWERVGPAARLHGESLPLDARRVVVERVTGAAVVLGSSQPDVVDAGRATAAGVARVRRRSGGGAVWVHPDGPMWVDVTLPRSDERWVDDVGSSFMWLGRAWAEAFSACGVTGLEVAPATTRPTGPLARTICFAALGPGEVTVAGAKAVGIAQRRTAAGALFACAVGTGDGGRGLSAVLDPSKVDVAATRRALAGAVRVDVGPDRLLAALADAVGA